MEGPWWNVWSPGWKAVNKWKTSIVQIEIGHWPMVKVMLLNLFSIIHLTLDNASAWEGILRWFQKRLSSFASSDVLLYLLYQSFTHQIEWFCFWNLNPISYMEGSGRLTCFTFKDDICSIRSNLIWRVAEGSQGLRYFSQTTDHHRLRRGTWRFLVIFFGCFLLFLSF